MRNPGNPFEKQTIDKNLKYRVLVDASNNEQVLHSLGHCSYLKVESQNHIYFMHQFYKNRRICI